MDSPASSSMPDAWSGDRYQVGSHVTAGSAVLWLLPWSPHSTFTPLQCYHSSFLKPSRAPCYHHNKTQTSPQADKTSPSFPWALLSAAATKVHGVPEHISVSSLLGLCPRHFLYPNCIKRHHSKPLSVLQNPIHISSSWSLSLLTPFHNSTN